MKIVMNGKTGRVGEVASATTWLQNEDKFVPVHGIMKMYGWGEIELQALLTSAVVGGAIFTDFPIYFRRKRTLILAADVDSLAKEKSLYLYRT